MKSLFKIFVMFFLLIANAAFSQTNQPPSPPSQEEIAKIEKRIEQWAKKNGYTTKRDEHGRLVAVDKNGKIIRPPASVVGHPPQPRNPNISNYKNIDLSLLINSSIAPTFSWIDFQEASTVVDEKMFESRIFYHETKGWAHGKRVYPSMQERMSNLDLVLSYLGKSMAARVAAYDGTFDETEIKMVSISQIIEILRSPKQQVEYSEREVQLVESYLKKNESKIFQYLLRVKIYDTYYETNREYLVPLLLKLHLDPAKDILIHCDSYFLN